MAGQRCDVAKDAPGSQGRENIFCQKLSLRVHISERRRDKNPDLHRDRRRDSNRAAGFGRFRRSVRDGVCPRVIQAYQEGKISARCADGLVTCGRKSSAPSLKLCSPNKQISHDGASLPPQSLRRTSILADMNWRHFEKTYDSLSLGWPRRARARIACV
jgi:hypothetical protein